MSPSPPADAWDEAVAPDGAVRPTHREALAALDRVGPRAAAERVAEAVAATGMTFGEDDAAYVVDPVPRAIAADDWARLEAGLTQRVRALDAWVADAHGPRRAIADGVVPASVLDGCRFVEDELAGLAPAPVRIAVAGLDVVRDADGAFRVLEDNCRVPSGLAYLLAAREAVATALGGLPDEVRALHARLGADLLTAVRSTVPAGAGEGAAVVLSDGPENTAWWEHQRLAALMGIPIVTPAGLRRRGERVVLAETGEPVVAVYRRTDVASLRGPDGAPTPHGELLLPALRAGTIGVANAYGCGAADDKAVYPYVRDLIRYFCGEEPILDDVHVHDLCDPETRDRVFEAPERLVFKPRDGQGGQGVVIGPRADAAELRDAVDAARRDPHAWIAQDAVVLSTHPTVVGDDLVPRHVDLRPFALADGGGGWRLVPGGLSRVAFEEGQMVVNSSRGGGAKDTWVLR
ncbi:circularly permuted type 2 ATP-grasp protein [Patulibacter sp. SYSU D01012]|uniref:circularly permuted type 2 ATP-grasp protein n=1 Tax=Patulibacter sp. SYSU D01012 TaxID=2817381 RepID=UPI001B302D27